MYHILVIVEPLGKLLMILLLNSLKWIVANLLVYWLTVRELEIRGKLRWHLNVHDVYVLEPGQTLMKAELRRRLLQLITVGSDAILISWKEEVRVSNRCLLLDR